MAQPLERRQSDCGGIWSNTIHNSLFRSKLYARRFSDSRSRSLYAVARPSVVCLSVVCRLSVTIVRPTQAVEIFGNISTAFGTFAIRCLSLKISRRSSRGTPPPGELNTRGVAKYSDFHLRIHLPWREYV